MATQSDHIALPAAEADDFPDKGGATVTFKTPNGEEVIFVQWQYWEDRAQDGRLIDVKYWFVCPKCESTHTSSKAIRRHGDKCRSTAGSSCGPSCGAPRPLLPPTREQPEAGTLRPPHGTQDSPPSATSTSNSPPLEPELQHSAENMVLPCWRLPPHRTNLLQTELMKKVGYCLRLDLGIIICLRPGCGHFVPATRMHRHLMEKHSGWGGGLKKAPTLTELIDDAGKALECAPMADKADSLWQLSDPPPQVTMTGRSAMMPPEEGAPIWEVLWCLVCDHGYLNRDSFLEHFRRKAREETHEATEDTSHAMVPVEKRLEWALKVCAQELTLQLPHKGYFQVCVALQLAAERCYLSCCTSPSQHMHTYPLHHLHVAGAQTI